MRPKANYTLAATLVAGGCSYDEAAAKAGGGISGQSLRRGLARKGVTLRQVRTVQGEQLVTKSMTMQLASQASELLKDDFAGLLQAHVSKLKEVKPSSNLRKAKEFADVIEPFARTAAKVHGWGDEVAQGLILSMRQADPDVTNAIDVDASCGPDTTTASVPDSTPVEQTPQQ